MKRTCSSCCGFRLRWWAAAILLLFVAAPLAPLAAIVRDYNREQQMRDEVRRRRGEVWYTAKPPAWVPRRFKSSPLFHRVVIVYLYRCNVDEPFAQRIGRLKALRSFELGHGLLNDETFRHMAPLTELVSLSLRGTQISDASAPTIAGMQKLEKLNLSRGSMTDEGIGQFRNLRHLETLQLADLEINGKAFAQGGFANLTTLSLRGCQVDDEGLRQIAGLETLNTLHLGDNPITDRGLAHLANLRELQTLSMRRTSITGMGFAALADLPKLEIVNVSHTALTDEGLARLAKLPRLRQLVLHGTKVSDAALAKLVQTRAPDVLEIAGPAPPEPLFPSLHRPGVAAVMGKGR